MCIFCFIRVSFSFLKDVNFCKAGVDSVNTLETSLLAQNPCLLIMPLNPKSNLKSTAEQEAFVKSSILKCCQ